jgi:hypothetical protein
LKKGKFSEAKYVFSVAIILSVVLGPSGESNREVDAEEKGAFI